MSKKWIRLLFLVFIVQVHPAWAQPMFDSLPVKQDTMPQFIRPWMEEIVVSGSLRPVDRLESPVPVEVYHSRFLQVNPVPSLFESLQLVNGVRPQLNCNICNTGDIHINGLDGPYTMVTIDGMPIVSGLSTVYGLFGIPREMIDRIEVVKGPASGLYGSEAVGGLINIITKSPDKALRISADLQQSSWQELQADLSATFRLGKVNTLMGIHRFHYDVPYDHNNDGFTDVTLQDRWSMFSKWQWKRKQDRIAEAALRFYTENRWGGQLSWNPAFRGSDQIYGEQIYTRRWEAIGKYQIPVPGELLFSWSYTAHHQDSWYGLTPFTADQQIAFGQLSWAKSTLRHHWLMGSALRYTFLDDNTPATLNATTGSNQPDKVWLPGIFMQDEYKLHSDHEILTGLRLDHHRDHGPILTPRFAWKWKTSSRSVFRLNTGTGFRVVNLFTEDHAALTGARKVVITEDLKPERSINVNMHYSQRFRLSGWSGNIEASLWHTRFSNRILPDYDSDPNMIFYRNLRGRSISRGISTNLEMQKGNRLRWMLGITWQDVFNKESGASKFRPMLVENWSGVWLFSVTFPRWRTTLDYSGSIYGPMRLPLLSEWDPRASTSPVWSQQQMQLSKKIGKGEVYLGIRNLLNWTPIRQTPFLIARAHDPFDKKLNYDANGKILATAENPFALSFDPTYMYAPNQGRRFYLGFRIALPAKNSKDN